MNRKQFYEWLEENNIKMEFANWSGSPSDTMVFYKNGEWFFKAKHSEHTDFAEVKEKIIEELN